MKIKFILVIMLVFLMISAYITTLATSTSNTLPNTDNTSYSGTLPNTDNTSHGGTLPYTDNTSTSNTLPNPDNTSQGGTLPYTDNTLPNTSDENSEEWLNKEFEFTTIIEVAQGTTVKEFIEQEKNRRLKEWYQDKINEGYTVEFGNAAVYAIPGATNKDFKNKIKLSENDLVRTNLEIEIGVMFSKDGQGYGAGEGSLVGVVVKGDLTGTGEIDVTDLSTMQEELVETTQLRGAYKNAADIDKNGEIDVIDLSKLQEYIVNN